MVRIVLMSVMLVALSYANSIKKNIYVWYIQEENIRLQNYSMCLANASAVSKSLKEKQLNIQKCEVSNTDRANELRDVLKIKLSKIKLNSEGSYDSGVEQQQRKRFMFKECISFATTDEQISDCYKEYNNDDTKSSATTAPTTTASK
jgi:hypothetical protein